MFQSCLSPDHNAVFRSKIHIVSFGNTVEIQEFVILLQICIDTQITLSLIAQRSAEKMRGVPSSMLSRAPHLSMIRGVDCAHGIQPSYLYTAMKSL